MNLKKIFKDNLSDYLLPGLVLLSGFLFFEKIIAITQLILGLTIWHFIINASKQSKKRPKNSYLTGLCLSAIVVLIAARLCPFLMSSVPLGYDTGIYRFELWSSFQHLPEYLSDLFLGLPLLSNVLLLLSENVDLVLHASYLLFSIVAGLSIALLSKSRYDKQTMVLVLLLFVFSTVQWKAFSMLLFKQMLSIGLIFFAFFLAHKKSLLIALPLLFMALLQPLDALFVGLSLLFYGIYQIAAGYGERVYYLRLFAFGTVALILLLLLDSSFWSQAWESFLIALGSGEELQRELRQGIFLSLADYGYQAAFFFVFGIIGWLRLVQRKDYSPLLVLLPILILWIALRLFFYQRLLIQLDAVLIFFAAVAAVEFFEAFAYDRAGKFLSALIVLAIALPFAHQVFIYQPLISSNELHHIEDFCEQLPSGSYVAATDSFYSPWLRGYCLGQRVIAPGLFEHDQWIREDWISFWKGEKGKLPELLGRYEDPVYFYRGEEQSAINFPDEYFERVGDGWWKSKAMPLVP